MAALMKNLHFLTDDYDDDNNGGDDCVMFVGTRGGGNKVFNQFIYIPLLCLMYFRFISYLKH